MFHIGLKNLELKYVAWISEYRILVNINSNRKIFKVQFSRFNMVQIQQKLVIDTDIAEQILELKEQLDSLMETIEILNSPSELNMLKQARMDVKKGLTISFKKFLKKNGLGA